MLLRKFNIQLPDMDNYEDMKQLQRWLLIALGVVVALVIIIMMIKSAEAASVDKLANPLSGLAKDYDKQQTVIDLALGEQAKLTTLIKQAEIELGNAKVKDEVKKDKPNYEEINRIATKNEQLEKDLVFLRGQLPPESKSN